MPKQEPLFIEWGSWLYRSVVLFLLAEIAGFSSLLCVLTSAIISFCLILDVASVVGYRKAITNYLEKDRLDND